MRTVNLSGKELETYESMQIHFQNFRNELFEKTKKGPEFNQVLVKIEEAMFWLEAVLRK